MVKAHMSYVRVLAMCLVGWILTACSKPETVIAEPAENWQSVLVEKDATPRHESAVVAHQGKLYAIGGRGDKAVEVFDPATNKWTAKSKAPLEIHHFQAVSYGDAIYIVGALTGGWPNETALEQVLVYFPEQDKFEFVHDIPKDRQRGAAGAVVYDNKIYLVGGITGGHMQGSRPWFDVYNPVTGEWSVLNDAPVARDHIQVAVNGDDLYVAGGRQTHHATNEGFTRTEDQVDVYNLTSATWRTLPTSLNIPTQRAGHSVMSLNNYIIVAGGESGSQMLAHNEVEVFDVAQQAWFQWPDLNTGRHGSGFALIDDFIYTVNGSGKRGGEPELTSIEYLDTRVEQSLTPLARQWHTITLDFTGPKTSEQAEVNPFTHYRLLVEFTDGENRKLIRGFYAADGDAQRTSAESGNVWQVRFTPPTAGKWGYKAHFSQGEDIALSRDVNEGKQIALANSEGVFEVVASDKSGKDFKALGRLYAKDGFFYTQGEDKRWMKMGANSPENMLAYYEFDGTYRFKGEVREGEAAVNDQIHTFASHAQDWREGDTLWGDSKGKNLIGGMNYLASMGMNSFYFLTLNINGDGKDVWPYTDYSEYERFDVSKLEQWNVLFSHMQQKGILLHVVTQETENERLLDDGNTGRLRQLYYSELIARFAHHNALVWNLGEENGPAEFTPHAQNDQQRMDMAAYLKKADPYNHPVLLHTHSSAHHKDEILTPLLGDKNFDGLSFQVDKKERVYEELKHWHKLSEQAGHKWLITMDEIGMWMNGARPDSVDPDHDRLRDTTMWGTLMAGGAGVEWYFGAHHPHNDINTEDWRSRHILWGQSAHAQQFFTQYVPFDEVLPDNSVVTKGSAKVLAKKGEIYVLYLSQTESVSVNLGEEKDFEVHWFNPKHGGQLQVTDVSKIKGNVEQVLMSPSNTHKYDWVALLRSTK